MMDTMNTNRQDKNDSLDVLFQAIKKDVPSDSELDRHQMNLLQKCMPVKEKKSPWLEFLQSFKQIPRLATVSVLLLAILLSLFLFPTGERNPKLAFAQVLEQIEKSKIISFTSTNMQGSPHSAHCIIDSAGRRKITSLDGTVRLIDLPKKSWTIVIPSIQAVVVCPLSPNAGMEPVDLLEELKKCKDGTEENLGDQVLNGKPVTGFRVRKHDLAFTVWAEVDSGFPVTIAAESTIDEKAVFELRDFQYVDDPDGTLFTMTHPEGYELVQLGKSDEDSNGTENDLIDALRIVSGQNLGEFPGKFDSDRLIDYLHNSVGYTPMQKDLDRLKEMSETFHKAIFFLKQIEADEWTYQPEGIFLNDRLPLCWWRLSGSESFRVVFGDLRIETLSERDLLEWREKIPGDSTHPGIPAGISIEFRLADFSPKEGFLKMAAEDAGQALYVSPEAEIVNGDLSKAVLMERNGRFQIALYFTEQGTQKLAQLTGNNINKPVAMMINGNVYSAPVIKAKLTGGQAIIFGDFSDEIVRCFSTQ